MTPGHGYPCDNAGYYRIDDILGCALLEPRYEGDRPFICNHRYDGRSPLACLIAVMRMDTDKCRYVIVAQESKDGDIDGASGSVAPEYIAALIRPWAGASMPFINHIRVLKRLEEKGAKHFACFCHRTKRTWLKDIFNKGLLPGK